MGEKSPPRNMQGVLLVLAVLTLAAAKSANDEYFPVVRQVNTTLSYNFSSSGGLAGAPSPYSCDSSTAELPVLMSVQQTADGRIQSRQDMVLHGENVRRGEVGGTCYSSDLPFWLRELSYSMINNVPGSVAQCSCNQAPNVTDCSSREPDACEGNGDATLALKYIATPMSLFLSVSANGSATAHSVWKDVQGKEQCRSLYAAPFTERERETMSAYWAYDALIAADIWLHHTSIHALPGVADPDKYGPAGAAMTADLWSMPKDYADGPLNSTTRTQCIHGQEGPTWYNCRDASMVVHGQGEYPYHPMPADIAAHGGTKWSTTYAQPTDFGNGRFSIHRSFPTLTQGSKQWDVTLPANFFDLPAACRI